MFPSAILEAHLHKRQYYDLRGFHTRSSRQWRKIRDFDEELARLAAHLNNDTVGRLLPLWKQEREQGTRRKRRWMLLSVVSLLTLLSLLLPKGPRIAETVMAVSPSEWRLSRDKKLALSFAGLPSVYSSSSPDAHSLQRAQLWRIDSPWRDAELVRTPMKDLVISSNSKYTLGVTIDNQLLFWVLHSSDHDLHFLRLGETTILTENKWDWTPVAERQFRPIGFTPDEQWCFAVSANGTVTVWSIKGNTPQQTIAYQLGDPEVGEVLGFLTPNARYFLALVGPDDLKIVDLQQAEAGEPNPVVLERRIYRGSASLADYWCAATTGPGELILVDLRGERLQVPEVRLTPVVRLQPELGRFDSRFSPAGDVVSVWQRESGCFVFRVPPSDTTITPALEWRDFEIGHEDEVWTVYSPNGKWVAVGSMGSLWLGPVSDSATMQCHLVNDARRSGLRVRGLAFSPDGVYVAATTEEGSVHVWKVNESPDLERVMAQHLGPPKIVFSEDGRHILTHDGTLVYFGKTGEKMEKLSDQVSKVQAIGFTNHDELVVLGSRHISWIRRSFYLWGVPVVRLGWGHSRVGGVLQGAVAPSSSPRAVGL